MATSSVYPLRVEGRLDPSLSRWLWLVKWLLVIPHYFVLAFLWITFAVLSVVAFFSILFTGRYPRAIFDFNVGVLRWSWRVSYYAYGALGTDRYPPFTLADVADYPAHLEVEYPERLSRGLVLVKWWLLAIPHYIVVGVLLGGTWMVTREGTTAGLGLVAALVFIAAFALAFTGRYPRGLFDLILGLNRWILRVAAYAGLMTDRYPPFRLDMGGADGGGTIALPTKPIENVASRGAGGWTGGRIFSVAVGAVLLILSLGLLGGGGTILWADRTQRDAAGFLSTPQETFATSGYAIAAEDIVLEGAEGVDWAYPAALFGDVRVRVTPRGTDRVFVGIAETSDVRRYLAGVKHATTSRIPGGRLVSHAGNGTVASPVEQRFWDVSTEGPGTQVLRWTPGEGSWAIVVMNGDGSSGVDVAAGIGARLPFLPWLALGLLVAGVVSIVAGALLVGIAVARAGRLANQ